MSVEVYKQFIARKQVGWEPVGFDSEVSDALFPFQRHVVRWALQKGRAAIFAETGLGKSAMQLEWARRVAAYDGRPVIIFAPLAVAQQTVREAAKFGITRVAYALDHSGVGDNVVVTTNYERIAKFDLTKFAGVVLDESSILKSFSGTTKNLIINTCRDVPYKLACTATPAPNDHMELGNHAEFLGVMRSNEMLTRWFINDTSLFGSYRLKGHAVASFWDWVSSWAMCVTLPSDLGYSDDGYVLPSLTVHEHVLEADHSGAAVDGQLFRVSEMSATGMHKEKRISAAARAQRVADLVRAQPDEPWLIWCDTDYEADALTSVLPEATEVRGSHTPEFKERAAMGFVDGTIRVLLSKPKIFGFGLNFQHVARVAFMGVDFSFEKYYQAVRRSWRFGQKRAVDVHVVMSEMELPAWRVVSSKGEDHSEMRAQMRAAVARQMARESRTQTYEPKRAMRVPKWLFDRVG